MYYYIFCFIIFPTSENKGRKAVFALIENLDSIEKINWTLVALEKVHNSITEIKEKKEGISLVEKKEGMRVSRKVRHANIFTPSSKLGFILRQVRIKVIWMLLYPLTFTMFYIYYVLPLLYW